MSGSLPRTGDTLIRDRLRQGKFPRDAQQGLLYRHYARSDLAYAGNPERFTSRRTVICVTLDLDPVFHGKGAKTGSILDRVHPTAT